MTTESRERNPYVGPRPFERQDRDIFFGRDREVNDLLSLIIAHRVLLLYAQSGAGKTSLINAGLIPMLEEKGFEVLPLARVQGLISEDIQPEEIPNLYVFNALMSWAENEADPRRLSQMSLAGFLKEREHPIDEEGLPSARMVIFDQFEELFTFYPEHWRDRQGFFEQVRDALDGDDGDPLLRVVFVIREDYIAQLDPYAPLLPEKLRTRFRLERLRKGAALSAVTGPLRDTECSFAEGVAEQLVEELLKIRVTTGAGETVEVTGEFVEPVQLQVVCRSLWWDLPPDVTVITQDNLQTFGDVDQALSKFYERSIKQAAQQTGVREGDLRRWFGRTLITPAGTRGTVYRGQEETGKIPNTAVNVLENLHLIRGEWRGGARWYELTHDRLIGPIQESNREWLSERWEAEQTRQWLETKATEWVHLGRGSSGLLNEDELPEAERWLESPDAVDVGYRDTLLALVHASRAEAERRRAEAERQRAEAERQRAEAERQRAEEQAKSSARLRRGAVVLGVLFLVAVGVEVVASTWLQQQLAAYRILNIFSFSFAFLVTNLLILLVILALNWRVGDKSSQQDTPAPVSSDQKHLEASDILGWEFDYARTTASEAMQDRHTMVNFYLLVAGILTSGVVAVLGQGADANLPKATGTALLWLLCGIGWLYFLKLVRLRQAWRDSAQAMNQIKGFYFQHEKHFGPEVLRSAFRWKPETLPPPDKPWTVFFYSATLIGLLDSVAYVAGGTLLALDASGSFPWSALWPLPLFGLAFFAFHVWLYFAFLKEPSSETAQDVRS